MKIPEPWMFNAEVTLDGKPVPASIGKFTLLGRLRMAWRALLGRPIFLGKPLPPMDDE